MKAYITAIGTATPPYSVAQKHIAAFMSRAQGLDAAGEQRLQALYRATGIRYRHTVIEDYAKSSGFHFYPDNEGLDPFPKTSQRMELYRQWALKLSVAAVKDGINSSSHIELSSLTHLITVSCTGMYAPGLDIELVAALGLDSSIQRTSINFMGCYAAFNALKAAAAFCATRPDAKVLIVCAELCSIHFQKEDTEDNLLANALFGDGAAAVVMESSPARGLSLETCAFQCALSPDKGREMAWSIGDFGFEMKLSAYVPDIIEKDIRLLSKKVLQQMALNLDNIDYFAIHPGGKRILEVIEKKLGLSKSDNRFAHRVLAQYGNMSSPTILFVLKEIYQELLAHDAKKHILGFAFGPGLTLESMLLKIHFKS